MPEEKKDIRSLSLSELEKTVLELNEPKFRAKQLFEWLWVKSASSFEEMSNLSLKLREQLSQHFSFNISIIDSIQRSNDGTIKCGIKLYDEKIIEGVLIPTDDRVTACISSQVGCSLTCKFCATGKLERLRNLTAAEIYDQVVLLRKLAMEEYKMNLTNIVLMGMGEPLLNYSEVLKGINRITSADGLNISPQRITLSSAGIAKMIKKLADDNVKFNLALSLHAANDKKRSEIMPINEQNSLAALSEALQYFYSKTNTRPTFEYILFDSFNDSVQDAEELALFCKNVPNKINIIEYNPIEGGMFKKADPLNLKRFVSNLEKKGIIVNVRRSRGKDIDAACGQLVNKNKNGLASRIFKE